MTEVSIEQNSQPNAPSATEQFSQSSVEYYACLSYRCSQLLAAMNEKYKRTEELMQILDQVELDDCKSLKTWANDWEKKRGAKKLEELLVQKKEIAREQHEHGKGLAADTAERELRELEAIKAIDQETYQAAKPKELEERIAKKEEKEPLPVDTISLERKELQLLPNETHAYRVEEAAEKTLTVVEESLSREEAKSLETGENGSDHRELVEEGAFVDRVLDDQAAKTVRVEEGETRRVFDEPFAEQDAAAEYERGKEGIGMKSVAADNCTEGGSGEFVVQESWTGNEPLTKYVEKNKTDEKLLQSYQFDDPVDHVEDPKKQTISINDGEACELEPTARVEGTHGYAMEFSSEEPSTTCTAISEAPSSTGSDHTSSIGSDARSSDGAGEMPSTLALAFLDATPSSPTTASNISPLRPERPWSDAAIKEACDLWKLSSEDAKRLRRFGEKLEDINHAWNNPQVVLGYMARPGSDKFVEDNFRQMIQWRVTNKVDTVLDEYKPNPVLMDYTPIAFLKGYDNEGDPIYVERGGSIDALGMLKRFKKADLDKHAIYLRELQTNGAWINDYEERQGRKIREITVIYDLKGLSSQHMNRKVLTWFKNYMDLTARYYPGRIKRMIIIRGPAVFRLVWNAVKAVFSTESRKKMIFTGPKNHLEILGKYMDIRVLPPCINPGGQGTTAIGMPRCLEGGKIPDYVGSEGVGYVVKNSVARRDLLTKASGDTVSSEEDEDVADETSGTAQSGIMVS